MEKLTPEWHEDSKEHCGVVIKDPAGAGVGTGGTQLPVGTLVVTKRTHGEVLTLVADLITTKESQTTHYRGIYRKYLI